MPAPLQIAGRKIRGLLIDLDGVLYVGDRVVPGSIETVSTLNRVGLPHCYVTNTTTHSQAALAAKLSTLGFPIEPDAILTAPMAARRYLQDKGLSPCKLLLNPEVSREFEGFEQSDTQAKAVVLGDIGSAWTYDLLNQVFRLAMHGAELIALHKNKFWQTERGLQLDIGAFVAGLEYCTGKQAVIVGKPSAEFFTAGARKLQLSLDELAMIGDDIDSDVGGAQAHGLMGILVRSGKYREDYADASPVKPDLVLDSFADLPLVKPT